MNKKGMIVLPIVLLLVLFSAFVFYGALKLKTLKSKVLFDNYLEYEDVYLYDIYFIDAILLDESCNESNNNFVSIIKGKNLAEINKCMERILKGYNEDIDIGKINRFSLGIEGKTLINVVDPSVKPSQVKKRYSFYSYNDENKVVIVEVEVVYGQD